MLKRLSLIIVFVIIFTAAACNNQTYGYQEITGHEISAIERIETNNGYMQSFRQSIEVEKANLLDVRFKATNKDIYSLTFGARQSNGSVDYPLGYKGLLYVGVEDNAQIEFVIWTDGHIYVYSPILKKSFVSVEKLDDRFFEGIEF